MGYDKQRFKYAINEGLICTICSGVLEDPVITAGCAHVFCRACITDWLSRKQQCPIDSAQVKLQDLRPVPNIIKSVLAQLLISCDYASNGCPRLAKLDYLDAHAKECAYNPKALVPCAKNCGMRILKAKANDHNCVYELRKCLDSLKLENQVAEENFTKLAEEHTKSIVELKQDLNQLKETSALNTKTILDEIKMLNRDMSSAIKKIPVGAALVPPPMEPLYQGMSLTGDWWTKFDVFTCEGYILSEPSDESVLVQCLQRHKDLVKDLHKFVLCGCLGQSLHTCGIEKLDGFKLNFRCDGVLGYEDWIYLCLVLKSENIGISNQLIPKCGYAFFSKYVPIDFGDDSYDYY